MKHHVLQSQLDPRFTDDSSSAVHACTHFKLVALDKFGDALNGVWRSFWRQSWLAAVIISIWFTQNTKLCTAGGVA